MAAICQVSKNQALALRLYLPSHRSRKVDAVIPIGQVRTWDLRNYKKLVQSHQPHNWWKWDLYPELANVTVFSSSCDMFVL